MQIESSVEEQVHLVKPRAQHRLNDVPGVFQPAHMTDLVAVICGDRQFCDAQPFQDKLDDDFGVEMEIIRVFFEWNLRQRLGGIKAVTGMKLGKIGPEHSVLKTSEDLVA